MFARLLFTIASLTVIAAALLGLRQQRLQTMHAMAQLHVRMDADRKATWDAQAQIAEGMHPAALREAVRRVGLELEPLPSPEPQLRSAAAEAWPDPDRFTHAPARGPRRE